MSTLTKTNKILGFAVLLLVVSVGIYYMLLAEIDTLHTTAEGLRTAASERAQRDTIAQRTAVLLRDTEADRKELFGYLLMIDDPTPLLTLVETLGTDTGATLEVESLTEVQPSGNKDAKKGTANSKESQKDQLTTLQVVAHVEGGFDQVYHLLTLLEHMPYIVSLTQMSLTRSPESNQWDGRVYMQVGAQVRK